MSIRYKVILPFLVLTLVVAITGVYVVTRLVSNSLSERLTNQLLEAGRVVSDDFVRQEIKQVDNARYIALTQGVSQALAQHDAQGVRNLVEPAAAGLGVENLILEDAGGNQIVQLLRQADGTYRAAKLSFDLAGSPVVQSLFAGRDPDSLPRPRDPAEPGRWPLLLLHIHGHQGGQPVGGHHHDRYFPGDAASIFSNPLPWRTSSSTTIRGMPSEQPWHPKAATRRS